MNLTVNDLSVDRFFDPARKGGYCFLVSSIVARVIVLRYSCYLGKENNMVKIS